MSLFRGGDAPARLHLPLPVFGITVQTEFAAAHAIVIRGVREPVHGHNWRVTVAVEGPGLDSDGLLCDFHAVEHALREITSRFHNRNFNELPPFNGKVNPTAENIARHIADELERALAGSLPPGARISRVGITEAPGCEAIYTPAERR